MAAVLRRRHRRPHRIPLHLGRSSLTEVRDRLAALLRDLDAHVVLDVVGFDYFDEQLLADLLALRDLDADRVVVRGLDGFAAALLPAGPTVLDLRPAAERAVTLLDSVVVLTAVSDGDVLDDDAWEQALALATAAGRPIVAVDLRAVAELSPRQLLALAETSAELHRALGTLMLVNAGAVTAAQLRTAGLSGGLRMAVDELG